MRVHPVVFSVSALVIVTFVVLGGVFDESMGRVMSATQDVIVRRLGWFYVAAVAGFFVFVLWMLLSRYGSIRLGRDDDEPEFSYLSWFAMLFSAGMGIGLLFFSVAEPVLHFSNPPGGEVAGTVEAARSAMKLTFFHWGLHAWAIYIIVAMSLAYFSFRHGLPLSIRSSLYPLIGERIHGPIGDVVDILAVFGTLFGLATSLGLGVMQVNAGLDHMGLVDVSTFNQVALIGVITAAATVSVVMGLDRGIRRLSELNLGLATLLLLFVLIAGPTVFLLSSFVQNVGVYASNLVQMTFRTDAFVGVEWQKDWTMFYWAWWISWSPFVGMFIARVSKGRTIREFIGGVLLVPTILTFLWLTVFGNSALHVDLFGAGGMSAAVAESVPTAVFVLLDHLPLSMITTALATAVVAIFFVTSSDSGSLVIDIITSGGHPDPPVGQRVFWAVSEGAVAAVLLLTGGLAALQTAAITTALPFSLIMVVMCVGLVRGLRGESTTPDPLTALRRSGGHRPVAAAAPPAAGDVDPRAGERLPGGEGDWRQRLHALFAAPRERTSGPSTTEQAWAHVSRFIDETVVPAFEDLRAPLAEHGREVLIDRSDRHAIITVLRNGEEEFAYAIHGHIHRRVEFAFPRYGEDPTAAVQERAASVVRSGRHRQHALGRWTREGIRDDFLDAYARWMGW